MLIAVDYTRIYFYSIIKIINLMWYMIVTHIKCIEFPKLICQKGNFILKIYNRESFEPRSNFSVIGLYLSIQSLVPEWMVEREVDDQCALTIGWIAYERWVVGSWQATTSYSLWILEWRIQSTAIVVGRWLVYIKW